jgi:chemotaxis protein MotB
MIAFCRNLRRVFAVAAAIGVAACGYSEDEWQAQLAKYNQLNNQYQEEQRELEATKAELETSRKQLASLSSELEKQGVDVENLNRRLAEEGTEKERLSADMTQLQQALEEYKSRASQLERIRQRFEVLRDKLQTLTKMGLKVAVRHNRMVISLPGDVLFASGQDVLREEGKEVLNAVAEVIRNDAQLSQRYFQVAGHTDSIALKGGRFSDNWGLSAMRARRVLVFLISPTDDKQGGGGLDPTRLHAAGYGDTDPIADNTTPDGRQQNRRVELVLMPNVEEMLDLKSLI